MANETKCKEWILSEEYRDFIINDNRTAFLENIAQDPTCEQSAGFNYRCVYLPKLQAGSLNSKQFSYNSIPKCYAPLSMDTLNQAGILSIQNYPTLQLKGKGILIGFIDSGIDYTNTVFRNLDGSTRIAAIWDQTIQTGIPPNGFLYGSEYTKDSINKALASNASASLVPTKDETGHGTFIASLAAGSAVPSRQFLGAAPESTIAVVKLKPAKKYLKEYYYIPEDTVCYQETDILLALRYLNDLAASLDMPLVLCIALGTSMGGHIGSLPFSSLLEHYSSSSNWIPVIGVGNEADKRHHYSNEILDNADTKTVEIRVGENVSGFTMELWTEIPNLLSISLISPSGETTSTVPARINDITEFHFLFENTAVTIDYRILVEQTNSELVAFRFTAPAPGIWKLIVKPLRIIDGRFHIWLPLTEFLSGEVYFLEPDPYYTLTNPANTVKPVIVSYYNGSTNGIALSSGRGYTRSDLVSPSITAPGIEVEGALPGGNFTVRSGSSIATAITAGSAALPLEWILFHLGNPSIDSYQIKNLMILGAVRPSSMEYPNREWGYGQLNLFNSLDEMRRL